MKIRLSQLKKIIKEEIQHSAMAAAHGAISAVFDDLADERGALTGELYSAYTEERDAILAQYGIALEDYLDWCEEQEEIN